MLDTSCPTCGSKSTQSALMVAQAGTTTRQTVGVSARPSTKTKSRVYGSTSTSKTALAAKYTPGSKPSSALGVLAVLFGLGLLIAAFMTPTSSGPAPSPQPVVQAPAATPTKAPGKKPAAAPKPQAPDPDAYVPRERKDPAVAAGVLGTIGAAAMLLGILMVVGTPARVREWEAQTERLKSLWICKKCGTEWTPAEGA